jgi:transcriptional regulator with XRE-family HTH domain
MDMNSEKPADLAQNIANWRQRKQKEIGERIKQERKKLGISLVEISRRLGIHRNTQSNYESGEREPDSEYFLALFKLGFDLAYINSGERLDDVPSHAADIAVKVFKYANKNAFPENVRWLFYLFGLAEIFIESGLDDGYMTELQEKTLVKIGLNANDHGNFSYATEISIKYMKKLDDLGGNTPYRRAEIILETMRLHQLDTNRSIKDIADMLTDKIVDEYKSKN